MRYSAGEIYTHEISIHLNITLDFLCLLCGILIFSNSLLFSLVMHGLPNCQKRFSNRRTPPPHKVTMLPLLPTRAEAILLPTQRCCLATRRAAAATLPALLPGCRHHRHATAIALAIAALPPPLPLRCHRHRTATTAVTLMFLPPPPRWCCRRRQRPLCIHRCHRCCHCCRCRRCFLI